MHTIFDEMDNIVAQFSRAADKFARCKGENCRAVCGVGHSDECKIEHDSRHVNVVDEVPSCFDRAEHAGRVFDNCRFFRECKDRKDICVNNPPRIFS